MYVRKCDVCLKRQHSVRFKAQSEKSAQGHQVRTAGGAWQAGLWKVCCIGKEKQLKLASLPRAFQNLLGSTGNQGLWMTDSSISGNEERGERMFPSTGSHPWAVAAPLWEAKPVGMSSYKKMQVLPQQQMYSVLHENQAAQGKSHLQILKDTNWQLHCF